MRIPDGKAVVPNFKINISWRKDKLEEKVKVHMTRKLLFACWVKRCQERVAPDSSLQ